MSELMTETTEHKLWLDGPNFTADAVVIDPNQERIFLVQRKDTGQWALPGGFVDPEDASPYDAAVREANEEGNLTLSGTAPLVFRGIVDDPRNTEDAWIETSAYLFLTECTNTAKAGDDAKAVDWPRIDELTPENLYASHAMIIERALEQMRGQQLFEILALADTALRIDAGHMEYDKSVASSNKLPIVSKSIEYREPPFSVISLILFNVFKCFSFLFADIPFLFAILRLKATLSDSVIVS